MKLRFLDLFAGGGGLSEGFIRAGYTPIAHVEKDLAASYTLKTRAVFHFLMSKGRIGQYVDYLEGRIAREELYAQVPARILDSVINQEIRNDSLDGIFMRIDELSACKPIDLIIGGPPCQAYSLIGRSRDSRGMKGDMRNYLYRQYAGFLERYKPRFFVFENVLGLLSAKDIDGQSFFESMNNEFKSLDYSIEYKILNASDYGVPQSRQRIVLVGERGKCSGFFPQPTPWDPGIVVNDVLTDLPPIPAGGGNFNSCALSEIYHPYLSETGIRTDGIPVTYHKARRNNNRDLEIYRRVVSHWNKTGGRFDYNLLPDRLKTHTNRRSFVDRFKVVAGNLPSCHTVMAHAAKDGHFYIHPDTKQNRSLTPRELARLQTFPDDFFFESVTGIPALAPALIQIGNAVPVLLAQKIAEQLKEAW
ncbi:MAG: DNA (cytosine-5-)-methyltransferase [Rectinemataceae bacterium]